tara:strand:- start:70604 stop:71182 length:579 start_codon:yes stop_codon:yes gene_type:complete
MVAGIFASIQFLLISYFSEFKWVRSPDFNGTILLESLRWNINSVLYEELVFRGYLLYKAIEFFGVRKACFLSASVFGVYHWFSYGVFGSVVPMAYVLLLTGSFGLMLAYSFALTKSVVLPIALHLGWNIVSITIFSNGPVGAQLLLPHPEEPAAMSMHEQLITSLLVPATLVLLVFWVLTKKVREEGVSSGP